MKLLDSIIFCSFIDNSLFLLCYVLFLLTTVRLLYNIAVIIAF